jgi:hypothetical protein
MEQIRFARLLLLVLLSCCFCACPADARERSRIDLNGKWEFRLDPGSRGETAHWLSGRQRFAATIQVSGLSADEKTMLLAVNARRPPPRKEDPGFP